MNSLGGDAGQDGRSEPGQREGEKDWIVVVGIIGNGQNNDLRA